MRCDLLWGERALVEQLQDSDFHRRVATRASTPYTYRAVGPTPFPAGVESSRSEAAVARAC
jgi:hypothetical protein